jgi:PAS domain S-box-containing protein
MPVLISPAASALADIGHLLESVELPAQQLEHALRLLGRFVPYDRCALLDADTRAKPRLMVVPEAPPEEHDALRAKLTALHQLVSDRPLPHSGALTLPEEESGVAQAHLAVPLIALDEAVGVLLVERQAEEYEEHHLQLLSVVAAQLGGYLTNVRLRSEEERATRAMQRAAHLLEYIKDGFLELDASLTCITANRAATNFLGLPQSQVVGADFRRLPGLGENGTLVQVCERALRERVAVHVEALHYHPQDRWFELEIYPTELGVSIFLRDISERRAAEEFRELLTGIIGHDLKTPLGAITLTAATLLKRGGLDGAVAQSIARIASRGARMSEMVSQLLDLTRIRAGQGLPIQRRQADLRQVCRDVVSEISAAHPDRQIDCEIAGELHGAWDVPRISQVLSNLVANAVQHGDPREPIRVSAQLIDDENAKLEVHNQGAPIPRELLPTLFQPFRQAAGKRMRPGSVGLGLFIAQSIVRAHGGTIGVASTAEAGTTFTVTLPRTERASAQEAGGRTGGADATAPG